MPRGLHSTAFRITKWRIGQNLGGADHNKWRCQVCSELKFKDRHTVMAFVRHEMDGARKNRVISTTQFFWGSINAA